MIEADVPVRISSELGRKEFVLVALVEGKTGPVAFPVSKGSGAVTSFSQADGFLEIAALASALDAGTRARVTLIGPAAGASDLVIMGSHDSALDLVLGELAERGFTARSLAIGSLGGSRLSNEANATSHRFTSSIHERALQRSSPAPRASVGEGLNRMQGFVHRPNHRRFAECQAADALRIALADTDCLMVNRNAGSGTRILIDRLIAGVRPAGYSNQPRSHNAVAAAVMQGRADWGIAIRSVATLYGLSFLPIAPEHYDFLLREDRRDCPAMQAFLGALRDEALSGGIQALHLQPHEGELTEPG